MSNKKSKKKTGKKKVSKKVAVESYRHESATRKNIPTAKIAAEGTVPRVARAKYAYSAHLSPELRFDASGQSDRVSEIVEKAAAGNKLTKEEADILRGVAANASQPWLEWSGKKEEHDRGVLEVEPVALHIHERVSANAIIRAAKREDVQADLFADPQQEYREAIQFYRHDVDWANRLILGDSLEVMSSLSKREAMAETVQTIFIDPPYGINFRSNFQSDTSKRDVKEKDQDLSRETETIKAFRDTWHLGVHSYLSYMRDRLIVAHELLSESGSIFVQISDENLHRIKQMMEEVFSKENFCSVISFSKNSGFGANLLPTANDYIVWFAKDKSKMKYRQLLRVKAEVGSAAAYGSIQLENGSYRTATDEEKRSSGGGIGKLVAFGDITKPGPGSRYDVNLNGKKFRPEPRWWGMTEEGFNRAIKAERVVESGKGLAAVRFLDDSPAFPLNNVWTDTVGQNQFGGPKKFIVQTALRVVDRCILMTSDPGDLVLDPTCGSGTTAFVSEQRGRRWITIDTSRVALSIARQRLITAKYEFYKTKGLGASEESGVDPHEGFIHTTVPHVTLGGVARNQNLDAIYEKHESKMDDLLSDCNDALQQVSEKKRQELAEKLCDNMQSKGIRAVVEADFRRWLLPRTTGEQIEQAAVGKPRLNRKHINALQKRIPSGDVYRHWEVPFDTDPSWPQELIDAIGNYRNSWRERKREIDECIAENSDQEPLYDSPEVVPNVIRVSGPFSVEGVRPEELAFDENGELFDPTPNEVEVNDTQGGYAQDASAYLDRMVRLISQDGVTFPNNEHRKFSLVERLEESASALHAEALWEGAEDGDPPNIAIAFGPQHGPVTASQVEDLIRASRRYDELVIAAFSFDGSSQAVIQESANPRLKIHMAHIRPDVSPGMDGLLKDSPKSQLFTVFGQPEIKLHEHDGEIKVELLGVDIYSPLTGEITSSGANKVAAWFLDSDYDGRCFCITQAFFPNQKAWDKIAKALGSSADMEAFEAYNGTLSVPFEPGEHQRIAVKVIDPRGNEVMAIRSLNGDSDHA